MSLASANGLAGPKGLSRHSPIGLWLIQIHELRRVGEHVVRTDADVVVARDAAPVSVGVDQIAVTARFVGTAA